MAVTGTTHIHRVKLLYAWLFILCSLFYSPAYSQQTAQPSQTPTELEQQAHSLKSTIVCPTGGVFTATGDIIRPQTTCKVLDNLHMLQRGVWSTRGTGYIVPYTAGSGIQTTFGYSDTNGLPNFLLLTSSGALDYNPATVSTTTATGSYIPTANIPTCDSAFDATGIVITNGSADPFTMPTTPAATITKATNWPVTVGGKSYAYPQFNARYYNRHTYTGMQNFPNVLLISADQSVNSWVQSTPAAVTDAGAIAVPPYLGPIRSLHCIRQNTDANTQCLLIGCSQGICCLTGSDPTSYTLSVISDRYGVPSNHTWADINNSTYFLATDGIRKFSNSLLGADLISSNISYPVNDLINRFDLAAAADAFVLPHANSEELIFYFPLLYSSADTGSNTDTGNPQVAPGSNGSGAGTYSQNGGNGVGGNGAAGQGTTEGGNGAGSGDDGGAPPGTNPPSNGPGIGG
jgi:hypothetical protein